MARRQPSYGINQPLQDIFPAPVIGQRAPATSDKGYEVGQIWVDQTTSQIYGLASVASGSATWSILGPGSSDVDTLTADSGGALSPAAGNITIAGGTNVTTSGSGSTITINLDGSISLTAVTATTITGTTVLGTTFDTNVAAAGVTLSGTTLAADGTDSNIDINLTPKGTGEVVVVGGVDVTGDLTFTGTLTVTGQLNVDNLRLDGNTVSSTDTNGDVNLTPNGTGTVVVGTDLDVGNLNLATNTIISTDTNGDIHLAPDGTGNTTIDNGGLLCSGGDIINTHSDSAADVTIEVTNSDNTSASSRAGVEVATGGTSSGDPYVNFLISGGQSYTMGIDNSTTNDDFVISDAAVLGTTNRISIDGSTGVVSIPTSDLSVTRAGGSGTAVVASVINTDNANADSPAELDITSGGTSGGDAMAVMSISGGQAYSLGVDNSTTNDDFVISDNATLGTNNRISIDGSTGVISLPTSDLSVTRAGGSGTPVQATVFNSDNANADSDGIVAVSSGGASGGDAYLYLNVSSAQDFVVGIDNSSTNDDFVISNGIVPGSNDRLVIDGSTGDTSVSGNFILSTVAKQIQMNGGAVTDFIGQATLTLGTVTVGNTNIAAGDRIFCTRSSINGSSALGILITAINAGSDFTITAVQPGTPASAETNDTSIVDYVIVRQN